LDVEFQFAEGDALTQFQLLFSVIHGPAERRPLAIVVEPVSIHGLERLARSAGRSGIGLAVLNASVGFLGDLRDAFPQLSWFAVGTDQRELGRIQGCQLRALVPGGGTVLYVQGPSASTAAAERLEGTREALAGAGFELVVVDGDWSESAAEQAVRSWRRLTTREIDAVAAQDDTMARGARRALLAEGRRWSGVPFLGIDGLPLTGQKLVDSGELSATVVMPSNTGPAIDALAKWQNSGSRPPARITLHCEPYPAPPPPSPRPVSLAASRSGW
jgi:ribose transport system substrate-binding protein